MAKHLNNVKLFQIVSVMVSIVSFLSFVSISYADIQFYAVDTDLSDNDNAKIKLTITFEQPTKQFQLAVFGAVANVEGTSNSGPVDCEVKSGGASIIDCRMNLTGEKRTLELKFETVDLIKSLDTKKLFSVDLSISQSIAQASAAVKLPEGYALANNSVVPAIYPPTDSILSDGRRIIVNWNIANITAEQPFKLQVLYEPVQKQSSMLVISVIIISALVLGGLGFFFYRRIKKPKEVILSVLDDFERKVVEVITAAGGELNQRKVVAETNLSKAKVSRVVKRLQERGLIEVTRLGRTNKLKLAHKKFEGS